MIMIKIPRLLVALAQAPFSLDGYDPELASVALEAACQHLIHALDGGAYEALVDVAHVSYASLRDAGQALRDGDAAIHVLSTIAIDGNADEFAGRGVTFEFEGEQDEEDPHDAARRLTKAIADHVGWKDTARAAALYAIRGGRKGDLENYLEEIGCEKE